MTTADSTQLADKRSPGAATSSRHAGRAGSILLLVLVVVAMLALTSATMLELMHNEYRASRRRGRQTQSLRLAESGLEYAKAMLTQTDAQLALLGGLHNNPTSFQAIVVAESNLNEDRGRFTILAPPPLGTAQLSADSSTTTAGAANTSLGAANVRFGLEDESSKLNLNALLAEPDQQAARDRLLVLPGMTNEIADAILDWLDEDDTQRDFGAEAAFYTTLDPPRRPRNGPLASLDELLQVRGISPELLYGLDRNRNFVVDADETPRGDLLAIDNTTGAMNRGWAAYLTLVSAETFRDSQGEPRLNVNDPQLAQLHPSLVTALDAERANFIILFRQHGGAGGGQPGNSGGPPGGNQGNAPGGPQPPGGPSAGNRPSSPSGQGQSAASIPMNFETPAAAPIATLLDLVGAQVQIPASEGSGGPGGGSPPPNPASPNQGSGQQVASPWQANPGSYRELLTLYDSVATTAGAAVAGRINVNAASPTVLAMLPGIDQATIDQIVSRRLPEANPFDPLNPQRHAVWLLIEGIASLEQMKRWDPYLTARGDVWSCQIVGFFDGDPTPVRIEAVFDRLQQPVNLLSQQSLRRLGAGFLPEVLGAQPLPTSP